jgi:membrane protease YdiL (CAAX protease family)
MPSLAFVIPILLLYEIGVAWLGGAQGSSFRTGIDGWVRRSLAGLNLSEAWLPPAALIGVLLAWQSADRHPWRFNPATLLGMLCESLLLAVALIGMSRLVDIGLTHLEHSGRLVGQVGGSGSPVLGLRVLSFLGAGLYEEALFRLLLLPALFWALRVLLVPGVMAGVLAVTGSSLLFSIAHHVGAPGEAFTWYAFIFRWFAGVYFAWAFVVRGFGVAVGTHVIYDCLVGVSQPVP